MSANKFYISNEKIKTVQTNRFISNMSGKCFKKY